MSDLTVMTRNLCLGVDLLGPLGVAADADSLEDAVLTIGHAARGMRDAVERTSFAVRSRLIAEEVRATRPDLIGVQELAVWRRGAADPDRFGELDADEVLYDFAALLLGALGEDYRIVAEQIGEDVEATGFTGSPFDGTTADAEDLRLTLSDALLVRRGVEVVATGSGQYSAGGEFDVGWLQIRLPRGFVWADVATAAGDVRVLSTHLEAVDPALAEAQALELVADPATDVDRLIVLGDLNSDPDDPGTAAAYDVLVGSGLLDLSDGTPTYGFSDDLDDDVADFGQRIDHVLGRGVTARGSEVTGATFRDPGTGLWASDHGGVVARVGIG